jgi:hypothetical protein
MASWPIGPTILMLIAGVSWSHDPLPLTTAVVGASYVRSPEHSWA